MYDKLVGNKIKIVFKDDKLTCISVGEVVDYDKEHGLISVYEESHKKTKYVKVDTITNMEVYDDE